jgi:hypothetical protein
VLKYQFNKKSCIKDPELIFSIQYLNVSTREQKTIGKDYLNGVACINKYKGWHPLNNMQLCMQLVIGGMLVKVQHQTEATMFLDR